METRIILIMLFFITSIDMCISQRYSLNNLGIGEIKIGANITKLKGFESISTYPNKARLSANFSKFEYFYFNDSIVDDDKLGSISDLFVIVDSQKIIQSVFIFLDKEPQAFNSLLESVFGVPVLNSKSSIEGKESTSKLFWSTQNGIYIFVTKKINDTGKVKIEFISNADNLPPGEKTIFLREQ